MPQLLFALRPRVFQRCDLLEGWFLSPFTGLRVYYPTVLALLVACLSALPLAADEPAANAGADSKTHLHQVESELQAGPLPVRVLLPDRLTPEERLPVIYLLPVEPGVKARYGDALAEVKRNNLHNKHRAVYVAPSFSEWPWYGDHPTDKTIQQESYFLESVVPLVESSYPVIAAPHGRLLLGFSKSGWGAWSLLLRRPDFFGKAAAWDAPLMMKQVGQYGNTAVFTTQANFEKHRIVDLLREQAGKLGKRPRLVLTGYGNFRQHHQQAHDLLEELEIAHLYRDGPMRKHHWESGWVAEAIALLMSE